MTDSTFSHTPGAVYAAAAEDPAAHGGLADAAPASSTAATATSAPVGAVGAFAADALAKAQADLAELRTKSAELADQFLRAKAEADNARRRAEEEISKVRKFAIDSFAESLLPVFDSLDAALGVKDGSLEQIREGVDATMRQLLSALERNKVVAIDPPTQAKFDPHLHQAISVVASEQEANTIVTVLQKGFLIADRVLRPALVTVSAAK
ncbi:nucleotide exchange factor GrpE [Candidatus Symbiobacter mobilis]|uniref:Protein GrpE n=1 Tax=Candidatus Symbiobacter mobilis CR TaxID=946483 RepID=U5N9P7_9BURK|nr:nucleotide exchange factor GrpE [Candidatus Symbiobacter mobilis]AGX88132.1 molecular chaperone GrpE [Candidatus Symbiobacter mobilis CR]